MLSAEEILGMSTADLRRGLAKIQEELYATHYQYVLKYVHEDEEALQEAQQAQGTAKATLRVVRFKIGAAD